MPDYWVIIDSNCRFDLWNWLWVYAVYENIWYPPEFWVFLYFALCRPIRKKRYNMKFDSIDDAVNYYYSHQLDFF